MTKKIIIVIVAFAFVLSAVGMAFSDDTAKNSSSQAPQLVAMLPASDGILTVDIQRLFAEALPQILGSNQPKLDKILGEVEKIKNQTGIDLTRFDQVAVGVKSKRVSGNNFEFEPVILARGTYDAGGLVAVAKVASKGKYREEKVGGRTIYIFSMKEIAEQNKPKDKNSFLDKILDKMFNSLSKEFALASYDSTTLTLGSVARVRETLEGKTRVSAELTELVYRRQNAVMSFGVNMPKGLSSILEMNNAEIDKNVDSIKQIYGALDVDGDNANLSITARTGNKAKAEELESFFQAMAMVGKALIGGTRGADKRVYSRMLENAAISRAEAEVMLDLKVSQSDIDILLGEKK